MSESEKAARPVLVTGASGFIGRVLCRMLAEHGYPLRTLWRKPPADDEAPPHAGEVFAGSLEDEAVLRRACQGVDTVFHLAGEAHVNHADRETVFETNVAGSRRLLEAAVEGGVRRIVYLSSILADPRHDGDRSAYGESKRAAEELLLDAHERRRVEVCCLRPVPVYGPGMQGNLLTLIRLAERGRLPPLPRSKAQMSLVGVEDLCRALLLAAGMPRAAGAAWPVTDGRAYHWRTIEEAIYRGLGRRPPRWPAPRALWYLGALGGELAGRMGLRSAPGLRHYRLLTAAQEPVDDRQTRRVLGYNPRGTLAAAMPGIIEWMRRQRSSSRERAR